MAAKIDLKGKIVGKLKVIKEVPKNERPTQNHGNYWECQCECGNFVKVPASYLTGNGNYTQQSCGCDRKRKAFKVTSGVNLEDDYLSRFQEDFEKYLLIHKALVRTSGQSLQYYNQNIDEYKKIIEHFWEDEQFNRIYSFWRSHEKENPTFYDWAKPSLDHIIPKSKGGSNSLDNFQFLTTFENLMKRDMTQNEWNEFKIKTNTTSDYFIENIIQ